MATLTDKNALMQVIGCLMHAPILLMDERYILTKKDFDVPMARVLFTAIHNLYSQYKAEKITVVDVSNFLQSFEAGYNDFKDNNGLQYLKDCSDLANPANFDYYYSRVKKLSALRSLKKDGFNIKEIYNEEELDYERDKKQQEKLDRMTIEEIFESFIGKINDMQCDYICKNDNEQGLIADNVNNLLSQLQENPEIGIPLQGKIYNTLVRGARRRKFYLISGASGTRKN